MNSQRRRLGLIFAVTAAMAFGASGMTSAQAADRGDGVLAAAAGDYFHVVDKKSGKCLDVKDRGTADGAIVQQYRCRDDVDGQKWTSVPNDDGTYALVNKGSGKCLDVSNGSIEDRAAVWQWACNGTAAQRWRAVAVGLGWNELRVRHSDKCLDVRNGSIEDRAPTVQFACNGATSQRWQFVAV